VALTRIISEIIQDNTVQDTDISSSFQASISGSFGNQRVGTTDDVQFNHITASGNISASGNLSSTGNLDIDGTSNLEGDVTLQSDLSVVDVNATNITGSEVSSSTALFTTATIDKIGGAIDFDNQNMTNVDIDSGVITGITDLVVADGGTGVSTLTDGGVLLGSGAGAITAMSVLADSEMIVGDGSTDPVAESGATLRTSIGVGTTDDVQFTNITGSEVSSSTALFTTATIDNIGAFKATGAIDFDNQNMTNVDIDSGVITGITDLTVADGGTGVSTLTDGGVLLGSGAGAITAMSVLTDGQMIVGDGSTDPVAESGATLRTSIGVGLTDDVVFSAVSGAAATFNSATINGLLTVEEIHTVFVSASVTVATGSNIFGDAIVDIHQFTGSIDQSGSLSTVDITSDNLFSSNITGSIISGSTALLTTATIDNIGAFTAAGAIDFDNQNMTNVDIDSGVITGITDLVVADGGTGVSTLTDGGVLLGNGAGAIQAMAVLTDGQMIVGDGTTDPVAESGATLRTSIGVGTTDNVLFANITGSVFTGSLGKFTTVDINGGTIDGITSLTAGGDLDIGAHDFRAETITADGLTATRVPFAGTAGVLSDDADLTFATATLSATNLTTTGTIKNMALVSGSFVSTGSVGRIQTRAADIGTITGTTLTTTGNITMADDTSIGIADDAERIEFDGAGDISVLGAKFGIGENAPGSPLDVKSGEAANTANFNSTNGATNITLESDGSLIGQFEFASTGTSQIVTRTVSSLALGVNNSQKLIISGSSGFVGIGEPSPDEMLHLTSTGAVGIKLEADSNNSGQEDAYIILSTDNASIVAELAITSNAGDRITGGLANATILGATTASPVQLFTTDIARLTVAAGGNVGIGTNAPAALLHLNTSDAGSIMRFSRAEGDEALVDNDIVGELEFFANDGSVASNAQTKVGRIFTEISSTALQTNIQFHTFGSSLGERMRINAAGRVGIKEDDPEAFLHVKNAGGATPALKLEDNSSGVNSSYVLMDIDFSNDADIENGKFIIFQDSGGVIGSISGDDDATSFNTSSDYRKKTDLKGIVDATGTINQLKLYDFAWKKNTDKRAVGVIAHEAQEVFPNAVSGEKDAMTTKIYKDENGDKQEKEVMDTQTVDYSKFIPLLLKSIQELTKRIEELEN